MSIVWLVIKTLLTLVPLVLDLIKSQKIKTAAQDEILAAFAKEFNLRLVRAQQAGERLPDENLDPNNRDR